MPGLPGSTPEDDIKMFKVLLTDERFMPDYLKIYPTLVTVGTPLYKAWLRGEYTALEDDNAVELIAGIKALLPGWVRLQRIQRDIPAQHIVAGVKKSHIRLRAQKRLEEGGGKCRCIRCREVGHAMLKGVEILPHDVKMLTDEYGAVGGREYFIHFEDVKNNVLISFLRLRFPCISVESEIPHISRKLCFRKTPHRPELEDAALVRELHVYGPMLGIGDAPDDEWQHRGYGSELLAAAERIASDAGYKRIAVISGGGVRDYYRQRGYELIGAYMVKNLS